METALLLDECKKVCQTSEYLGCVCVWYFSLAICLRLGSSSRSGTEWQWAAPRTLATLTEHLAAQPRAPALLSVAGGRLAEVWSLLSWSRL